MTRRPRCRHIPLADAPSKTSAKMSAEDQGERLQRQRSESRVSSTIRAVHVQRCGRSSFRQRVSKGRLAMSGQETDYRVACGSPTETIGLDVATRFVGWVESLRPTRRTIGLVGLDDSTHPTATLGSPTETIEVVDAAARSEFAKRSARAIHATIHDRVVTMNS